MILSPYFYCFRQAAWNGHLDVVKLILFCYDGDDRQENEELTKKVIQIPKEELFEAYRVNVLNGRSDITELLFDWADEKAKRQLKNLKRTLFVWVDICINIK